MSTVSKTPSTAIPTRQLVRVIAAGLALCCSPILLTSCMEPKTPGIEKDPATGQVEARLARLEAKDEISSILLKFCTILDDGKPAALATLGPKLHSDFRLDLTDFVGTEMQYLGLDGLVQEFGPMSAAAQSDLVPGAIAIEIDGDMATATFTILNSVRPPPQLGLDMDVKVLVMADSTAKFVREGAVWKLRSIEVVHTLAYPGSL